MMQNRPIVVIPAYNEEKTIKQVIERTLPYADIVVVNDGSRDRTRQIVESFKEVMIINHQKNTHIPQSVLDGMKLAYDRGYDYVITMDSGLSHKPEEIPNFLKAPDCDLVLGYRKKKGDTPLYRKLLSMTAAILFNIAIWRFNLRHFPPHYRDVTSGFRRYSRKAVGLLLGRRFKAKSFDFITESLMFVYRNDLTIMEIPITYDFSNSSLNGRVVRDSFRMFLDILLHGRK